MRCGCSHSHISALTEFSCFSIDPILSQGYHKQRAFIATQGPLPNTTNDFWRMVWENNSVTIVMLTKKREGGSNRCHKYWPANQGVVQFGCYQVILHGEQVYQDYIQREFKIVDTKSKV